MGASSMAGYFVGHSQIELRMVQAVVLRPITERLPRSAGLRPGMRVTRPRLWDRRRVDAGGRVDRPERARWSLYRTLKFVRTGIDHRPQVGAVLHPLHVRREAAVAVDPVLDRWRIVGEEVGGAGDARDPRAE